MGSTALCGALVGVCVALRNADADVPTALLLIASLTLLPFAWTAHDFDVVRRYGVAFGGLSLFLFFAALFVFMMLTAAILRPV